MRAESGVFYLSRAEGIVCDGAIRLSRSDVRNAVGVGSLGEIANPLGDLSPMQSKAQECGSVRGVRLETRNRAAGRGLLQIKIDVSCLKRRD
jgi:hypothetical protein